MKLACTFPAEVKAWEDASETVVSLSCEVEDDLWYILDCFAGFCFHPNCPLEGHGLWVLFHEPDIGEDTSIACLLTEQEAKRLSHLPLLLQEGR